MSDRVAIMDQGRIVQTGTPSELYERPRTRFVADFLGKSNVIAGEVAGRDGDGLTYATGGGTFLHRGPAFAGSRARFALRPEKMRLSPAAPPEGGNRVRARVTSVAYLGPTLELGAEAPGLGQLAATLLAWQAPQGIEPGSEVWLSWPPEATVALQDEATGI